MHMQIDFPGTRPADGAIGAVLAAAYPGLTGFGAGAPVLGTDAACALAARAAAEYYPEHRGALLFGSFATGRQTAYSDLDVLVVMPPGHASQKHRVMFDGRAVELFVVTERTLLELLAMSRRIGLGVFFDAMEQGLTLKNDDGLVERLRGIARHELERTGIQALNDAAIEKCRVQITLNLVKLSTLSSTVEQVQMAVLVYNAVTFALLRIATGWAYRNERLPREFRARDAEAADALDDGLAAIGAGKGPESFIAAAAGLLDRLGGPAWVETREPMMMKMEPPQ